MSDYWRNDARPAGQLLWPEPEYLNEQVRLLRSINAYVHALMLIASAILGVLFVLVAIAGGS